MEIAGNVGFFGVFWVFLEKGVESTFLNIRDNLRQTYFFEFFIISSGLVLTQNIFNIRNF